MYLNLVLVADALLLVKKETASVRGHHVPDTPSLTLTLTYNLWWLICVAITLSQFETSILDLKKIQFTQHD